MNIAISTIYNEAYCKDKLFDVNSCKLGNNLLLPGIEIRKILINMGHNIHTIDFYESIDMIDIVIFYDIPSNSLVTLCSFKDIVKYIIKRSWRTDYLLKCIISKKKENLFLILQEPKTVCPKSYNINFHKYFHKVLTWDDSIVDNTKYFKYFYPQPVPNNINDNSFKNRKLLTLIASNKTSNYCNELYSKRRDAIDYCEKQDIEFDLYGYGWEKNTINSYKGTTNDKLKTLSNYKFCICYENEINNNGYITEKIFDCFFSHCIPVYLGSRNVKKYIPSGTFVDRNDFDSFEEVVDYIKSFNEKKYNDYIKEIDRFIESKEFRNTFSLDNYINTFVATILGKTRTDI